MQGGKSFGECFAASCSDCSRNDRSPSLFGSLLFDARNESCITRIVVKFLIEVILLVFQNTVQELRKVFRGIDLFGMVSCEFTLRG